MWWGDMILVTAIATVERLKTSVIFTTLSSATPAAKSVGFWLIGKGHLIKWTIWQLVVNLGVDFWMCLATSGEVPLLVDNMASHVKAYWRGTVHALWIEIIFAVNLLKSDKSADLLNAGNAIFPNEWKKGVIVMILKKGTRLECGNCRSISVLVAFSKMLA